MQMNKKYVGLAVAAALAVPIVSILPAMADDDVVANDSAIAVVPTAEKTVTNTDVVTAEASEQVEAAEPVEAEEAAADTAANEPEAASAEAPESVSAQATTVAAAVEEPEITPAEAKDYITDLNETVETLKQIQADEPKADWSKEFDRLFATASELTQSLAVVATGNYQQLANPDLVLARTHLVIEIGLTIDKSTDNLRYKIQKSHVELGFAVTRAILRVGNIGATEAQLQDSIADLRATYDRVSAYRDLRPTDTATIYVKNLLNKAIWNTRIQRDKEILTHKDFRTYNTLNKHITKAVGVWFRAKATVADCDAAIADLNAAYATAYAAPSVR